MADVTRITFNENGLQELTIDANRHVSGIADRVVNQAIVNASGRPGPRIRTGDLVSEIEKSPGADGDGPFFDIGSNAVSPRQNYPYPSRLETGEDGVLYPWLKPALEQVIAEEQ